MKDIFKPKKQQLKSADKKKAVSNKRDVDSFLAKVAGLPKTVGQARLIFSLDATASRQATWDVASQLQTEMFLSAQSLGGLAVQLCYFRGFGEFRSTSWASNADQLMTTMSGLSCQAGTTQIERLLRHSIKENESERVKCLVYIGDAMEENIDVLAQLAGKLGLLNVPVFMFQERNDSLTRQAFLEISRLSGGAYCQFDSGSAGQLKDLLKAVAVYAAGGLKALRDFSRQSPQSVKLLEQQLRS